MTIRLRDYQEEALKAEARHRAEVLDETRLAIVLPTGAGKTITFAERARRHVRAEQDRVLILVHTDELAQQAEAKVHLMATQCVRCASSGWDPEDVQEVCWACRGSQLSVGVVKAERDETGADIIIGSVQTLANPERRARITDVGLVIVDECHHATAASYQAIMRHFGCMAEPCEHTGMSMSLDSLGGHCTDCMDTGLEYGGTLATPALGFTATLERGDGQGLGEVWQDVAYSRDVAWGVRKGHLVQPIGYRLEIDFTELPDRGYHILTESSVQLDHALIEAMAPEKIVEKWMELAKDRPTVAFMPLVWSAVALASTFEDAGFTAAVISGDMPTSERRWKLQAYEDGRVQVLVNAMVLTEGWDSPRTSCVIVGRPTKSRSLFVQMAGRGLRPVPGTPVEDQDCILITVADATTDLCSIADLSDRPLERKLQGALTAMEDEWNIGKELDEAAQAKLWTGQVDARQFDPLVTRSSKVWRATEHGTPFLPTSKDGEYVFIVGTSVWWRHRLDGSTGMGPHYAVKRLHKDLPDLELAMTVAEDEAQERGGDLGKLLADKNRAWRREIPSGQMQGMAQRLGLGKELISIMESRAGGKAGKVSDLISKVQATRALEPMVKRIKEATA